jgi:IclR family pca regulon transcriptional regulator
MALVTKGATAPAKGRVTLPALGSEVVGPAGDVDFMTSLARGLAVMRAFSERGASLTIADLSRRVGIPRAAVRRCLHTLELLGYVGSLERAFFLKPKVLTLGYAYFSADALGASVQPVLDRVSATVQESCSLAMLSGDDIVYVARATTSKRIMSIDISVGTRLPAHCTSMGRVLLAHLPPAELERSLARLKLKAFTPRTVTSRERLRQILRSVLRAGYALVDQELEIGLRSLAVPVRDLTGNVTAALNVGTQAARISAREMEMRLMPVLRAASEELTALRP